MTVWSHGRHPRFGWSVEEPVGRPTAESVRGRESAEIPVPPRRAEPRRQGQPVEVGVVVDIEDCSELDVRIRAEEPDRCSNDIRCEPNRLRGAG